MVTRVPWIVLELEIKSRLPAVASRRTDLLEPFLRNVADAVRRAAYKFAPVLTGALRESISVTTVRFTDHFQRVSAAQALRPEASFAGVTSPPENAADVHASAHYATYHELGAVTVPHPSRFLSRGVEEVMASSIIGSQFVASWKRFWPGLPVKTYKYRT